jgi:membrane protein required for colicin V production
VAEAGLQLGWVDLTLLGVLALSVLVGLVRGFVFEALSLAGWVVAYFAAQWAAPFIAERLPIGTVGGSGNQAAALVLGFFAAFVLWSILIRLLRSLIRATPLSIIDRLLGAVFGGVRGAVILMALTTLVAMTPLAQAPQWQAAHGVRLLELALAQLKPLLPEAAARWLPGAGPNGPNKPLGTPT